LDGDREGLWKGLRVGWEGSRSGFEGGFEVFFQFSDDSHLLGEKKVIRNPLIIR